MTQTIGRTVSRKIQLRLIWPILFLLFLNSLDRVNVSFGALQMNAQLGLSPKAFGFGVGLFFIGYILFQVPSAMLLRAVGARKWLFGVVFSWGLIATGMAFINSAQSFYGLRVLLGFAEAGFAPGTVYICTQWMPSRYRALAVATTMLAIPISIVLGGPLSGWLMSVHSPIGLAGWRWMYLAEGLPTVLLAVGCLGWFVDTPAQAKWLSADEKAWLASELEREAQAAPARGGSWLSLFARPAVWAASGAWFALLGGAYGVIFWLPQVVKQMTGAGAVDVGLITAVPWIAVALGMVINSWHSDHSGERFAHVAGAALLAAAGFAGAASVHNSGVALACLAIGGFGLGGAQGAFWTIPPTFLGRMTAVSGIAVINMAGNMSGVVGPYLIGLVRQSTGSFTAPIYALAAVLAAGAVLILLLRLASSGRVETDQPASVVA